VSLPRVFELLFVAQLLSFSLEQPGSPCTVLVYRKISKGERHSRWTSLLLSAWSLPFDLFIVVYSTASRAQAIHCRLDIVVAELAYLEERKPLKRTTGSLEMVYAYLIAAGTRVKTPV